MPSILSAFLQHVERAPDKPCILFEGQTTSYGQLAGAAAAWAARLRDEGLTPGQRVALYLENSPDFIAAYLGCHMVGGVVVLVNTAYRQVELRHILSDSGASICITDEAGREELGRLEVGDWGLAIIEVPLHSSLVTPPALSLSKGHSSLVTRHSSLVTPNSNDLALLAYTSGTTGRSKGAMLSHGNLAANIAAVAAAWEWTDSDRLLLTLPLFHIHGLGVGTHGTLFTGASMLLRRHFNAAETLDTLAQGQATMFFGVPTMYTRLIAEARARTENQEPGTTHAAAQAGSRFPSAARFVSLSNGRAGSVPSSQIRLFVSGSAPLSPQTFAEFAQLFGQPILERYGMTETGMNLTNPYRGERRPGTVGMPFPGQQARIVDVATRQPLPPGAMGEIQVRGPHVFQGYWQRPEATAEAFDGEGWFNTGDLGQCSTDGYFTISGRARELIITGGYNVYPREVEEVLLAHPAVAEAAVFGLPDAEFGERVVAAVVLIADCKLQIADCSNHHLAVELQSQLVEYCREQLASYKKPREFFFVESLPRNALGKVQKHLLREQKEQQ
ncbi:MAG: acyl-CoA synthetase [Chloroflexaceae bacterium]|jgi:malonyl-CoA/methylmalonyl-CoA synthetase|nr:acyl-CoA synthetase [Chloroflexaceae bacterium]